MKLFGLRSWFDTICAPFARAHGSQITHHERSNRRLFIGYCLLVMFCITCGLSAASLDGTSSTQYKTTTQIFRRGLDEYVRGFARLGNGFAIASRASGFMDTNISVSGQMDLGETGTLVLLNNLYFDRSITLTSGGNIKGKATVSGDAKTIFLGGDMTLSATTYSRVLHITGDWSNSGTSGDLIIDGRGHTLDIQDRAQIFVDTNVTLTLRNMTIRTGPKSLMTPPIRLASQGSKLTLDNVMFDLGADFQFKQGQIFIHDEVAVTGTSAFIYQSPVPSYITSGATWSFEYGTTFSVAPVTFTDCPFTVNNTYTNNNFIVLTDSSSALYLNSCSLKTTYTGLRLTKGMVLFDNRVAVDTMAGLDLASTATTPFGYVGGAATGTNPRALTWSPDGRFLAVVNENSNSLQVYRFNGSTAPTSVGGAVSTGNNPKTVAWSPDGRFIALTNYTDNTLQVYRFTGNSKPVAVGGLVTTDTGPLVLAWSSDGRFIASVNYTVSSLQIFRFQGSNAPLLVASAATGTNPGSVTWLPDGRFLAVGNRAGSSLQMYQFNGRSGLTSLSTIATGAAPYAVTCSPDGRFVGVVNYVDSTLQVYRFYGRKTPVAVGTTVDTPTGPEAFTWSPDGRFLVAAGYTAATLQAYRFNGVSKPTLLGSAIATGSGPYYVAWSSDGKFLAVAAYLVNAVQIFRCNYYFTGQPTQGFTNGMVFGDSAKGSNYNANVKVLAGAGVVLQGKVTDDSA